MTVIAAVLILTVLLAYREREVRKERERWETERSSLLDRIQHPEVRQISVPEGYEAPEVPADAAELAYIGQEVPEFIHVGTKES